MPVGPQHAGTVSDPDGPKVPRNYFSVPTTHAPTTGDRDGEDGPNRLATRMAAFNAANS